MERDIFPWLGSRPVSAITAPELLTCLRRIEARGALDTAHRAHQNCGQIFRYAIATGRAERDPSGDLRGALPPATHVHYASITEPEKIGALLRAIDGYDGTFVRTRSKPISDNTLNAALRRVGYTSDEVTTHGFRSMASTLLNEQGWDRTPSSGNSRTGSAMKSGPRTTMRNTCPCDAR